MSDNLEGGRVNEGQVSKEVTINNALGALDAALTEVVAIDMSTGDVTTTAAVLNSAGTFVLNPAAAQTLTLVPVKRRIAFVNVGDAVATIDLGTASIDVPAGKSINVALDGTANGLSYAATATMVPPGGAAGQALVKNSGADFDATWGTIASSSGGGSGSSGSGSGTSAAYPALTELTMTAAFPLTSSSQESVVDWQAVTQDDVGAFNNANPTRMTVPSGYTRVRFNIYMAFINEGNASGKGIRLQKNGNPYKLELRGSVYESNSNMQTAWLEVQAGDYFETEALTYGSSGGCSLAAPSGYCGPPVWQAEWRA